MITQQDIKVLNKFRNSYYNCPEEELRNVAQVLDKLLPQFSQQEKKNKLLDLYLKRDELLQNAPTYLWPQGTIIEYEKLCEEIKKIKEELK